MKKYTLLTILSAVALLASCNRVEPQPQPQFNGNGLILSLDSGAMTTKADDDAPALPAFETAIDHFDFFFFDDEAGTTPTDGMHAHINGASTQLNTGAGQDYEALRFGTHYVYILANYPGTIDHSDNWKLADILALEFESELVSFDDEGTATFCENLVMDSYHIPEGATTGKYTVELTPAAIEEQREVTVSLSRIAAKLSLTINVKSTVAGTMNDTWTPLVDEIQAYYVNALNNKSTVDATPVRRADLEATSGHKYCSYPNNYNLTKTADYTFVLDDVYTYPQTWNGEDNGEPYFKIYLPWFSNRRGTSNLYYKVNVPAPDSNVWTIERNCWYNVTVELSVVDSVDDYVEVDGSYKIQDWAGGGAPGGSGLAAAKFFDVPVNEFTLFSSDSLAVSYSSNSAISAYFTQIKYSYYGASNGTLATYEFNYTKADNKTRLTLPNTDSNGQTVVANAKDANQYTLTSDGRFVIFEHELTGVYTERQITFVIENLDGRSEEVTVTQHPSIEIKTHETKNGFVNGWFARATADVKDGDGNLMGVGPYTATHFGGGQYYHSTDFWKVTSTSGTGTAYPRIDNDATVRGSLGIIYGDCSTSVHADCMFITEVTVSAFNTDNDSYTITYSGTGAGTYTRHFRIGDPRQKASERFTSESAFNIPKYLYSDKTHRDSEGTVTVQEANDLRDWESPLDILIANNDVSANEVIAPRFLVSSNMNNMSSWPQTNATCVRRAATYQEAGYPAGRWRLPTEAEINFMMTLQQKGIIPELYAFGSSYQCANGRAVNITSAGARNCVNPTSCYVRFVYDLWYWGDEPMDPDVYHPNMHEH